MVKVKKGGSLTRRKKQNEDDERLPDWGDFLHQNSSETFDGSNLDRLAKRAFTIQFCNFTIAEEVFETFLIFHPTESYKIKINQELFVFDKKLKERNRIKENLSQPCYNLYALLFC